MKLLLFPLIMSIFIIPAYGETNLEFGYQLHPGKLLENTEGTLQIYISSNDLMIPTKISNLKVTSSDSKIVEVIGIEQSDDYSTIVKIKAIKSGEADIAIAAPGYKSQEIPITVFTSNNRPTQLLIKTTPNDFAVDGPRYGYVTVELATAGGLPVKAENDITVRLISPNADVVELESNEIIIEKGHYYAYEKFLIKDSGDAIIFAESDGMKKVSDNVHVREIKEPLTLQLHVFPKNYLSMTSNIGYAIVQLVDGDNIPVKATEDITVRIAVENPDSGVNTSQDKEEIIFQEKTFVIKKDTYSAYTSFVPRPDFSSLVRDLDIQGSTTSYESLFKSFNIGISAKDYNVKGDSITIYHDSNIGQLNGNGPVEVATIPFLATGGREIIGVAYMETTVDISKRNPDETRFTDTLTIPVMADKEFVMKTDSSSIKTVDVIDPIFKRGQNAALIFGNTGTVIPDSSKSEKLEIAFEDNSGIKVKEITPNGPIRDDLSLTVDVMVPEVLDGESFPILAYMLESDSEEETTTTETEEEEEDGRMGLTHFISDTVITFSADDIIEIEPHAVKQNQPYAILTAKANKVGETSISGTGGGFDTQLSATSKTTEPTQIHLSYLSTTFPGIESLATIQLLNSGDDPVYLKNNVEVKLIVDNPNILDIPDIITINEGEYFSTFKIRSLGEGSAQISTLAENLPLNRFDMDVASLQPTLTLQSPDSVYPNDEFTSELRLSFNESAISVSGYNVEWNVQGAEIKNMDSITNADGKAKITTVATDPNTIRISATISGNGLFSTDVTKPITIIQPILTDQTAQSNQTDILSYEQNAIYFIIPVAIGVVIFLFKRTNMLDGIMERFALQDKIYEIKERMLSFRNR